MHSPATQYMYLPTIEYKLILAALIDSEQMLLSIEAQLCTRRECKTFSTTKAFISCNAQSACASMLNNICSEMYLSLDVYTYTSYQSQLAGHIHFSWGHTTESNVHWLHVWKSERTLRKQSINAFHPGFVCVIFPPLIGFYIQDRMP